MCVSVDGAFKGTVPTGVDADWHLL